MEGKKSQPRVLLVFGAPCSGKTTFCEKFASRFGLTFFDLDSLRSDNSLSRKTLLIILEQIAKTRQTILLEGELKTEKEREEIRRLFRNAGYITSTIWIQTDLATIRARLKSRHKTVKAAKEVYDTIVPNLEAPSNAERPIILSGKHTFETQVKHVLAGLA